MMPTARYGPGAVGEVVAARHEKRESGKKKQNVDDHNLEAKRAGTPRSATITPVPRRELRAQPESGSPYSPMKSSLRKRRLL